MVLAPTPPAFLVGTVNSLTSLKPAFRNHFSTSPPVVMLAKSGTRPTGESHMFSESRKLARIMKSTWLMSIGILAIRISRRGLIDKPLIRVEPFSYSSITALAYSSGHCDATACTKHEGPQNEVDL